MSEGEITARHFATGEAVRVRWADGVITSVESLASAESAGDLLWIAPSLVDLQVNVFAGIDFQQDGVSADQLLQAVRGLNATGCTRFLLTLITDEWSKMLARLKHYQKLCAEYPEIDAAIAGWHIEGPFLSPEPGFCGAHDPAVMRDPTPADMESLAELLAGKPIMVTLAPEREGALESIRRARELGITISIGHANPSAERLHEAVDAGASALTHLGNACPQQLDRHDNFLWRALDTPGFTAGLIVDGIHVSPMLLRLFHKALVAEKIYYTTDAVAPAGAPPGRYTVGRLEVEVGEDLVVRQPGRTNFAGSALTPIEGVRRAAGMLDRFWQQVWPHFSEIPARLVGLEHGLVAGARADFCLLDQSATQEPILSSVHACGRDVFRINA